MKWTVILSVTLIGLVAGDGAWHENLEYKYKLVAKTFVTLPGDHNLNGEISYAYLTIRPQSRHELLAQITLGGTVALEEKESNENASNESKHFKVPKSELTNSLHESMKKPFIIHMNNNVIRSLSVDTSLTTEQVNQLKYLVSQFQLDINAQHAAESHHHHDVKTDNAFYVTMEPTVTGECETTYDISRLPQYVAFAKRDSIPMPQLVGDGHVIQIHKNRNYDKCNERTSYLTDLAGHREGTNQMHAQRHVSHNSRILITGTLSTYIIQSAATTKEADGFKQYIYLTLESINRINKNHNSNRRLENLKRIDSLVYKDASENEPHRMDESERGHSLMATAPQMGSQSVNAEEGWTGCWTRVVPRETICKTEFSAEWEPVESRGKACGFLGFGVMFVCRRSFPGCEATVCFSQFVMGRERCVKSFGNRLPVPRGAFKDCAPGFLRSRCCPR